MAEEYKVFIASPGDVSKERDMLSQVVAEINQIHSKPLDYSLELLKWETHTAPGAGRPQQVINEQIGPYDIFIGIMWRRFGTPTGVADSGTEEEFRIAYKAWQADPSVILMFYFCQKPFMPRKVEELDQMRKILLFRHELEGKALFWNYSSPKDFEGKIRKHLCMRMNRLMKDKKNQLPRAQPNENDIHSFRNLWGRMDPELQKAMSVAYNENRLVGDAGIQTRDLFAALLRVRPAQLEPIVEDIPKEALPKPTSGNVIEVPYIIKERPWLSHCVASSIQRLGTQLQPGKFVTTADIFTDIAKNGTGSSVSLLRQHNIGPQEIDKILAENKIQVLGN